MSAPIARLGLIVSLASFPAGVALAQSTGGQSAAKERAEGDPNGSIRSLGAAGFNDRDGAKPPAVIVPPLDEGPSGTSGVPMGTAGGRKR